MSLANYLAPKAPHSRSRLRAERLLFVLLVLVTVYCVCFAGVTNYTSWGAPVSAAAADQSCTACHRPVALFSHPVNVLPSMNVPMGYPLANGQVTCLTCHQDATLADHSRPGTSHDAMLRSSAGTLCAQCHVPSMATPKSAHAMAPQRAHLFASGLSTSTAVASPKDHLDAESTLCISCHDGTTASNVASSAGGPFEHNKNHPIGVPMALTRDRFGRSSSDMPLVPRQLIDQRIRFFDDKVGCGSCHSPYSTERNLLAMPNRGSQLCLGCHRGS